MTPETVQAIGEYIVVPIMVGIAAIVVIWLILTAGE